MAAGHVSAYALYGLQVALIVICAYSIELFNRQNAVHGDLHEHGLPFRYREC